MWIVNCWQVVAFAAEIDRNLLPRTVVGEAVVLYRTKMGDAVALADRCPHRLAPLSLGRVIDDGIQCGYHGLRFDQNGFCIRVPGQTSVPGKARVRAYPVVERHKLIWIWMGDASLANPELVPNYYWLDDPTWAVAEGYHHFAANYQLLNDNLLDLSHESFVHEETIGNESVADSPASVTRDGNAVRVHRDMLNVEAPPFYKRTSGFSGRIDRWHTTNFTPPGFHVIDNGTRPAGADNSQAQQRKVINIITPETVTSSHYFWAVVRQSRLDDQELTEYIRTAVRHTFDQDKVVIEAQQRVLGSDPDSASFPVSVALDAAPIQGRRLLKAMLARDREGSHGGSP